MLSFIYHQAMAFEQEHGFRPNLLCLNRQHYDHLRQELAGVPHLDSLVKLLGMEVVVDSDVTHPRVAWSAVDWSRAIAV